ncbi:glutamate receptor subunit protein GluR6 [Elysia marginata]|uniref:Glutamate receptor subunit protein GluR6 n=1 Tax=Elysia marginata TaxID=1093978 RepID=A0AAV4E9X5_9GAST|nr:glutamate receptor subunit protein GluR6 [Elysia marginata]
MLDQKRIIELVNNENRSFTGVALEDHGSDDVAAFKKAVQSLRKIRPEAVVGRYSWAYATAAEHMRIPYFVTSMTPRDQPESPYLIQLFPSGTAFAQAADDTVEYYKLRKIAVFHDTEIGQVVLEKLAQKVQMEVTGFFVTKSNLPGIKDHLKIIRSHYFNTIVTILNPNNTIKLLDEGLKLSMFSPPHKWVLLNMGLTEYALQKYVDSRANITVLRLMMDLNSDSCLLNQADMTLEMAAFQDGVQLSAHIAAMKATSDHTQRRFSIRRTVKNLQLEGCTGKLEFSKFGKRKENFLQLMTLQGYLTGASGTWRSAPDKLNQRMEPFRSYSVISKINADIFPEKPLRITIIIEPPFIQKKTDNSIDTGHPVFEGFCIDILIEMSRLLGFKYNLSEVPDGKFGSLKPYGWTGMIKELVHKRADVAVAPFQMSTERAEVVDFTKPFMTKGTTVVVKRPDHRIGMFQFLSPFSHVVWSAIFVAFVGTSLMLFGVSRVNSDRQAKYAHNLRESFWYIWGTLLRGSLTGSPHAISSRIVSSAWWFFALIISSIYTANLAAFLTITISDVGINTAADLAIQIQVLHGFPSQASSLIPQVVGNRVRDHRRVSG